MANAWDEFERAPSGAAPAAAQSGNPWDEFGRGEVAAAAPPQRDLDGELREAFNRGLLLNPTDQAGVNAIARQLGIPPRTVEYAYPEFKKAAVAVSFDPARFRREYPGLAELLLENPQGAPHPLQAEQISGFSRALRATFRVDAALGGVDAAFDPGANTRMGVLVASSAGVAEGVEPGLKPGETLIGNPFDALAGALSGGKEVGVGEAFDKSGLSKEALWPAPQLVPTKQSPLKGRTGLDATAAILKEEGRRGLLQNELGDVGFSLLVAHATGENTDLLERRQIEIEQEIGAQVDYGQNAVEQLAVDITKGITSQAATLEEGAKWYGVGAALVGAAELAATRNPIIAAKGAHQIGLIFGKVGFSYGSFKQEAGSTYAQLLGERLDDGTPLDRDTAAGIAFLYGVAAAAVEVASFGELAKSLGPFKDAIAKGEARAVIRAWINDRSKREILKGIGKQWVKSAGSEALEEGTQTTLEGIAPSSALADEFAEARRHLEDTQVFVAIARAAAPDLGRAGVQDQSETAEWLLPSCGRFPELSPAIRSVFAHMLATDGELAEEAR